MSNLILTVNIVLPIFLIMAIGFFCRWKGVINDQNVSAMNKLVFQLFLPASLCQSMLEVESDSIVDINLLLFGFAGTLVIFFVGLIIIPRVEHENSRRGVMIQGLFRSNYAIFGITLSQALFPEGDGGVAAMMVIATVPLYNALGVICLEMFRGGRVSVKKILIGIAKNPLIWGCLIGFIIMISGIQLPAFATSTIGKLADVASPLALFALGASINLSSFRHNLRSLCITVAGKLIVIPAIALSIAYACGYRGVEFAVLMIVFATPCAVNSYTMAAQMDGDAELAAQQVMLTTVLSAVTIFLMIFLFKTVGIF